MEYRKPRIVRIIRASTAISAGANGNNPVGKSGTLQEVSGSLNLSRSTSGAYQADE